MSSNKNIYNKEYYANNKAYWSQKFVCEICGGKYIQANKSRHNKSIKHKKSLMKKKLDTYKTPL